MYTKSDDNVNKEYAMLKDFGSQVVTTTLTKDIYVAPVCIMNHNFIVGISKIVRAHHWENSP